MQQSAPRRVLTPVLFVLAVFVGSLLVPAPSLSHTTPTSLSETPASVPPNSNASPASAAGAGPHPGTLEVYEVVLGGWRSEDPSVAYDTASEEPIVNVYQTLIAYNGSSTESFVPELATCVPGSTACTTMYGESLIQDNATSGEPEYYTFVLDPAARFYDPSTGASWPVFPSDVMFTLSRTMSFAELPEVGVQNGWIQAQALLPDGNPAWDGGIHSPYNNTPGAVLASMLVNDSAYCPAAAMNQNGCITFVAGGGGTDWPFFLQLIADPLGASIEPCGWFTYVGAGVPGFAGTEAPNGDGSCLLPGGATSTTQASFQAFLTSVSPTAWDGLQLLAATSPLNPQPAVQESMVGSGPYYAGTIASAVGYVLKANPAYAAPTGCAGEAGCQPLPGTYQGTVDVFWEDSDTAGLEGYETGQADLATIEFQQPQSLAAFDTLQSEGAIDLTYIPELAIWFMPYNLDFDVNATQQLPGGTTNVPGDFFSQIGLREFITNAYPYATVNSTVLHSGNISLGFGYGGAIPKGLDGYYAYNITWPQGDPVTDPNSTGGAAWWWAEANDAGSPYYDPELSACTTGTPCTFPIIQSIAVNSVDSAISLLVEEIESLSDGRLQPYATNDFNEFCGYTGCGNLDTLWSAGWSVDYPDPSDVVTPLYVSNSTGALGTSFTNEDSVPSELSQPEFNSPSCAFASDYREPADAWAALVYYHSLQELPDACQGIAYNLSTYWYEAAATLSIGPQRTLDYQMANQLDYLLSLYIWNYQQELPETYAPWIDGATLNANPMLGGGSINPWYSVEYNSTGNAVTFREVGMPPAAGGGVEFNGYALTPFGADAALTYRGLANGSYPYTILPAAGYYELISSIPGSPVTVNDSNVTVSIVFRAIYTVTFTELGMPPSAGGGVAFNGSALTPFARGVDGLGDVTFSNLTNASYPYEIEAAPGYLLTQFFGAGYVQRPSTTVNGSVTVRGIDAGVNAQFGATYSVTVDQSGVPNGTAWTFEITATSSRTPSPEQWSTNSTGPTALLSLPNGTYSYTIAAAGYATASGSFTVVGQPLVVPVTVHSSPTGWPTWSYVVLGLAAAVLLAVVLVATLRRRRPPPGAAPRRSSRPPS